MHGFSKYFDRKYLNLMRMLSFVSLRLPVSHVGYALTILLLSLTSYGYYGQAIGLISLNNLF